MAITKASAQTTVNSGVTAAAAATINQILVAPASATTVAGGGSLGGVTISNVSIMSNAFANASVLSGDTAVSTAGGFVKITGTGFKTAANVFLGSTVLANTFVSATQINANIPASSAATYQFTVFNTDGSGAIYSPGLTISGPPSWTTTSYSANALNLGNIQLLASGDAPLTYYIQPGSANPENLAVNSTGYLSGTVAAEGAYTITVIVDDAQGQSTQADITVTISVSDVYFNRTTVALPADTTTWVTDASTNAYALTVNGDTRPSAFSPYKTVWSNSFDGTGDYLSITNNAAFKPGTGDFTIEFWGYLRNQDGAVTSGGSNSLNVQVRSGSLELQFQGVSFSATSSLTGYFETWTHFAFSRNSGVTRLFFNGTLVNSITESNNYQGSDATFNIGYRSDAGFYLNGYISNLRLVKGTALYTTNFTPSTSALTAIANTSLLTCQNNRFIDNSANNFTITNNGGASVSNFAPFIETDTTTGSGYFDGTGDYLTAPANTAFNFGTGDFTLECWIYSLANQANFAGVITNWTSTTGFYLSFAGTSNNMGFSDFGTYYINPSSVPIINNVWTHVAVTRSGTTLRMFFNGQVVGTALNNTVVLGGSTGVTALGSNGGTSFNGYISDARIIKGTAVYTATFTPPTSPLTAVANTSLLTLQYPVGENNNRFVDSSGFNHLVTRNGNATQGTYSPFSQTGWSNYFDGTNAYLSVGSSNAALDLGGATASLEMWVFPTAAPALNTIFTTGGNSNSWSTSNGIYYVFELRNGIIRFVYNSSGGPGVIADTNVLPQNQWNHIVLATNATTMSLFVNGTRVATATATITAVTTRNVVSIASYWNLGQFYSGYLSNIRHIAGVNAYSASATVITIPTTPLTAVSGTNLLTCQSNRFIDNSTNNFTITPTGTPSVQAFSPFYPTAAYTPATIGGSGYFDGTGDYLSLAANTALNPGASTTPFSIECWLYPTSTPASNRAVYGNFKVISYPSNCDGFDLLYSSSRGVAFRWGYPAYADSGGSAAMNLNTWNHVVVCRNSSGSMSCFLNGVRWFNTSSNTTITNSTASSLWIGWAGSISGTTIDPFPGYIAGFRMLKGTTAYDPTQSTLTVPTAPPTNTTDTSLLLNFTNAGIVDATAKNTFETVGAARVSTALSKFGGSSVFIPDTGNYIQNRTNYDVSFGSGDFTIEAWIYWNSLASESAIMHGDGVGWTFYIYPANRLQWGTTSPQSPANLRTGNTTLATGQWYHIAVTRSGTTVTMWVNGVSDGTVTDSANYSAAGKLRIGTSHSNYGFNGYMDDIRITKGFARYTATFTPPTATFKLR